MPLSRPPGPPPAIVARLRAGGCVFAEDEARLLATAARTPAELAAMTDRRAAGFPLEQVLGWAEFCGLRVAVEPGVFVPRRRTEFLVRQAVLCTRPAGPRTASGRTAIGRTAGEGPAPARGGPDRATGRGLVIVDLCCGSGAVGAALAAILGPAELHAVDIDPAAVRCARRNLAAASGRVYTGDLYAPLPAALRGQVDLLAANAPYVPTGGIGLLPAEAREHEPQVALDGGADGLDTVRRVAAAAPHWLRPGGHLVIEASERQARPAADAVGRAGLIPRVASSGELGATVVIGYAPAGGGRQQPDEAPRSS